TAELEAGMPASSVASTTRSLGRLSVGGVVSTTWTANEAAPWFPLASELVQMTVVEPSAKVEPDGGAQATPSGPGSTVSLAVGARDHRRRRVLHGDVERPARRAVLRLALDRRLAERKRRARVGRAVRRVPVLVRRRKREDRAARAGRLEGLVGREVERRIRARRGAEAEDDRE